MNFDIKIYGVHQRDFLIESLRKSLNLSKEDIIYDDRPNGGLVMYTFCKAFSQPYSDITHRLCLPDDMIVCNNFIEIINKIINAQSDKIVCLFPYCFHEHEVLYEKVYSPYIRNNGIVTGNGIIMPVQYIEPFINWSKETFKDKFELVREENALYRWAKINNIQIINTIPSPVQHIGDDYGTTLPYPTNGKNRKTEFFMKDIPASINWDCKDVLDFPNYEYDFIKMIRQDIKRGKGKFLDENFQPRKKLF